MLNELLNSDNIVVRVFVAALFAFGPLYLAASYGADWALLVAVIAFLGILLVRQRSGQSVGF